MKQVKQTASDKAALKIIQAKCKDIQGPTDEIDRHFLNKQIKAQSEKWDAEGHFLEFEQALDTLDLISDALPDDPKLSNALNGLHGNFDKLYQASKLKLLAEVT